MKNLNINYSSSASGLKQLETRLKKMISESLWETFLHTTRSSLVPLRKSIGSAIKVQPTRRSKT